MKEQAEEIAREMEAVRAATVELFDTAREEDLRESPGFGFRPVVWHLAHIGVFEAYWLLQKLRGEPPPDEHRSEASCCGPAAPASAFRSPSLP